MSRTIRIAAAQRQGLAPEGALTAYAEDVRDIVRQHEGIDLVVHPELHLFDMDGIATADQPAALRAAAVPLSGDLVAELGRIARESGVWLVPGSICELGPSGELFNTALALSPEGELVAHYRKLFPWRPFEPYDPGDRFVTFEMGSRGRLGLSICYDTWFPEVSRHLAWYGAEAIINVVRTTTPDRAQELVLVRGNSIANQVFTVSVNCAAPTGMGASIVADPEGAVLYEAAGTAPETAVVEVDLDHVSRVRRDGTAGTNRVWDQFRTGDHPLALPLYQGRIDPDRWAPRPAAELKEENAPS